MASRYVEEYAKKKGITVAEAYEHAVVKEYLKYHPQDEADKQQLTRTRLVAGCGCAGTCEE